jgi:hypothetical protein
MKQTTNADCSSARKSLTPHLRGKDTCPGHAARGVLGTVLLEKIKGYGFAPKLTTNLDNAPIAATHTAPMRESIELREAEVKKEAFMEGIKAIAVNDL